MMLLARMFALLLALAPVPLAAQTSVVTEHARAELIVSHDQVRPGETLWAALKIELDPNWHTYWRNPGDSGLPAVIAWTLPNGMTAGDIVWPAPTRIAYGTLMNFGYDNLVVFPVPLTIGTDVAAGTHQISAAATWLVCAEICIPADGAFRLDIKVGATSALSARNVEIEQALAAMPKPAPWPMTLMRAGAEVVVTAGPGFNADTATFFPHDAGLIDNAAPQRASVNDGVLQLRVAGASAPLDLPAETGGVLVLADNTAYTFSAPVTGSTGAAQADLGLWAAIILAFGGGLILNLMPCVLPVLAMKTMAFARDGAHAAAARRRDGLAYTVGVLVTFAVLAGLLLVLRGAGTDIGWGFQLQSPAFVAIITYLFLALGLNLSGVFNIGGNVMGAGQSLTQKGGAAGAFFTGALAVIVATPCTAPLMGAAIGFAVTQPAVVTFVVFESLALGLAAPFLLFSFAPGLARLLPRPGVWMDRFKQALAFPMYASAAWLIWVLTQQLGPDGLAAALAGLVFVALAAWLFGVAQTGARRSVSTALALLALLAAAALVVAVSRAAPFSAAAQASTGTEPYSAQRLTELRAAGRPVFVNFTAAWCITCLMNERVALSAEEVKQAFADNNVAYLKADWTNRDAEIAKTLAGFGRSGVPLYVLYPAGGGAPVILPQLLTPGLVRDAIMAKNG